MLTVRARACQQVSLTPTIVLTVDVRVAQAPVRVLLVAHAPTTALLASSQGAGD